MKFLIASEIATAPVKRRTNYIKKTTEKIMSIITETEFNSLVSRHKILLILCESRRAIVDPTGPIFLLPPIRLFSRLKI